MLCLPSAANYSEYRTTDEDGARLYGYEYYTSGYGLLSRDYIAVHLREVACATCEVVGTTASSVFFGQSTCPDGYVRDYVGYIFSNADGEEKGEFVCVEKNPEGYGRSYRQNSEAKLYPVEADCSNLPCPPYTSHREILCVQCSKMILSPCLSFIDDGACLAECPRGNFGDSKRICQHCHEECLEGCFGPSALNCSGDCRHARFGNECVRKCPEMTYENETLHCLPFSSISVSLSRLLALLIAFFRLRWRRLCRHRKWLKHPRSLWCLRRRRH